MTHRALECLRMLLEGKPPARPPERGGGPGRRMDKVQGISFSCPQLMAFPGQWWPSFLSLKLHEFRDRKVLHHGAFMPGWWEGGPGPQELICRSPTKSKQNCRTSSPREPGKA